MKLTGRALTCFLTLTSMNVRAGSVQLSETAIVSVFPFVGATAYAARESSGFTLTKRRHSGTLINWLAFLRIFNASDAAEFESWLNLIASIAIMEPPC